MHSSTMRRKRLIINVNEEKCIGCGRCVDVCLTSALAIVNGKAKLIDEKLCDGFGSCIVACPYNALYLEYREAEEFNWDLLKNVDLSSWMKKFRKIHRGFSENKKIVLQIIENRP